MSYINSPTVAACKNIFLLLQIFAFWEALFYMNFGELIIQLYRCDRAETRSSVIKPLLRYFSLCARQLLQNCLVNLQIRCWIRFFFDVVFEERNGPQLKSHFLNCFLAKIRDDSGIVTIFPNCLRVFRIDKLISFFYE